MNSLNINPVIHALISSFEDDAFAFVNLNGVDLWLPAGTLITMYHCVYARERKLGLYVETAHWSWMFDKLCENCIFMDVGAATGVMSIPFAIARKDMQIYAFEPASRARRLLGLALQRNAVKNVEVIDVAVAEGDGEAVFDEVATDESGQTPFLPETSSLVVEHGLAKGELRSVKTTSLDSFAAFRDITDQNIVLKIDIEGFEICALRGANEFISRNNVYLSIDIHPHLGGQGDTERECREILLKHGYSFEKNGHVLLCSPNGRKV